MLDSNVIVDGSADSLLAAQISLRRPGPDVSRKKLDLLKLSAGGVAAPRTEPPESVEVMRIRSGTPVATRQRPEENEILELHRHPSGP
jgi:hypothetical protein